MLAKSAAVVASAWLVACAGEAVSSGPLHAGAEPAGGEVRVSDMPAANIEVLPASLVVWGMIEVPAGSRMQAAEAMVDAITRAELLKLVRVGVGSLELDVESSNRREIEVSTVEAVQAKLPSATVIQHGWQQDGDLLRLVGRLEVNRELLQATFSASLAPSVATAIVAHLFGDENE